MANPAKYKTLSEITDRILKRVGFVAQDASDQYSLIHDFIRSSHEDVVIEFEDMLLQDVFLTDKFNTGQSLYDITPDADPEQVKEVVYRDGPNDQWCRLIRGIPLHWRDDERSDPTRYEIRWGTSDTAQLEFYPTPEDEKEFGYSFKRTYARLTQDGDRTIVDSELVFLKALALAQEQFGYGEESLKTEGKAVKRLQQLRARSNHGYQIKRGLPTDRRDHDEREDLRITIVHRP